MLPDAAQTASLASVSDNSDKVAAKTRNAVVTEKYKAHQLGLRGITLKLDHGRERNTRRGRQRIAVDAGADRGQCDRATIMFHGQLQAAAHRAGQQFGLARVPTAPYGTDRVRDETRGQASGRANDGRAGRAATRIAHSVSAMIAGPPRR